MGKGVRGKPPWSSDRNQRGRSGRNNSMMKGDCYPLVPNEVRELRRDA